MLSKEVEEEVATATMAAVGVEEPLETMTIGCFTVGLV